MKITYDVKSFNDIANPKQTNCLAFVFGQTLPGDYTLYRAIDPDTGKPYNRYDTPVESFIQKAKSFGFNIRQVESEAETEGKLAFFLWGWFAYKDLYGKFHYDDFHVARKNPDGSFEHKPDNSNPAEKTSMDKIQAYGYTEKPYIFVLV